MKKIYVLGLMAISAFSTCAQSSIPNGGFESWQSGAYDQPTGYTTSNPSTFFHCSSPFNVLRWPDSYHGSYAVKLTTNAGAYDTCVAYMVNSPNPGDNNPCLWNGGMAYNQMPTAIRGYYKCNVAAGDSATILVGFRNGTNCLGFYFMKIAGVQNAYTPFQLNFNPPIAGTPDTMVFAAASSDVFNKTQKAGSMLQLDSLSFVGASNPAAFDGDFESWLFPSVEQPMFWHVNTDDRGSGVGKTSDMHAGSYAVELTTYAGSSKNSGLLARSGQISTGYYLNNCQGMNCQQGGFPFTNQIDTLCFYFKYSPMNGDTASVDLAFKKNGSNIGGMGMNMFIPTSNYSYMEIPFNTFNPVDTAIVSFHSSSWSDTLLAFVGSNLKIDDVHFKSQSAGTRILDETVNVNAFPNPSPNGSFVISNVGVHDLVRVYNNLGEEVPAQISKKNNAAHVFVDIPGFYTVFINARGKISTVKIVVGRE